MVVKTREKLIEVARQLFVHKGLENTTMNDIANASEKGRRTIYTYFRNKKEIYNAGIEAEADKMTAQLKAIASTGDPTPMRLRNFLLCRLEQGAQIGSTYSSIKSLFKFDLRSMEKIRRLVHDKETSIYNSLIAEGINQGHFDADRCRQLSLFLLRCVQGMDLAEIDAGGHNSMAIAQHAFVNFILDHITVTKQK